MHPFDEAGALAILSRENSGERLNDDEVDLFALVQNGQVINPYASILHAAPSPTHPRTLSGFEGLIQEACTT